MKRLFLTFIGIISILLLEAQKISPHVSAKDLSWLNGGWVGQYNNAPFYEGWRTVNDSILVNFTIEIKGSDTIVKENGALRLMQNRLDFVSKDATWKIDALSSKEIILRNDTIKYANRITWSHSSTDHWLTEIQNPSGVIRYDLVRVAWIDTVIDRYVRSAGKQ